MKRAAAMIVILGLFGCQKAPPPRNTGQGTGFSFTGTVQGSSSTRPAMDTHALLGKPASEADSRLGKPKKVDGEWRTYATQAAKEIRLRYVKNQPVELHVELARPADSAMSALRSLGLNEPRAADESAPDSETWKGRAAGAEWESLKVAKKDGGFTTIHGIYKGP